jgi:hypothetical protein
VAEGLYIQEPEVPFGTLINPEDSLVFIGSCFSDEISAKSKNAGLISHANPYGTLFHPISIGNLIEDIIHPKVDRNNLFQRGDVWLSWSASSKLVSFNQEELRSQIAGIRSAYYEHLRNANYLFVTFGTAWGYRHTTSNELVANCHKMPASLFEKELCEVKEMEPQWDRLLTKLREDFPDLHVCFTVSPVRHIRDGLVENQRSKARLIELVHSLVQRHHVSYLPVYELLQDVYRDYRFFSEDLVHPNALGIEMVWKYMKRHTMDVKTQEMIGKVEQFRSLANHRVRIDGGEDAAHWRKAKTKMKESLLSQYPHLRNLL